ncbi:R-spondin-4 isoform X2 [Vicugna pacos]|uniref:R-spondin-4 isoform X2 n=1 Tax=Vicugna pacos TaxID=30538 RepID=A0ABM5BTE2_VICPA
MRAPLCLLLLVAHAADMLPLNRRKKQVGTGLGGNCTGCVICSEENGCSTCQQKLFLFIHREGIRQYGKCVHDCPPGYYGVRGQEVNRCKKECELGPWGSWSPCTHNGKTCGSAWGLETRVREAGRAGQEEAATCQVLSESRKCPIRRPCPGERNPNQKKGRREQRPRKERKQDGQGERRPRRPPA